MELPYGTQFTPEQIGNDLYGLLKIVKDNETKTTSDLIDCIVAKCFSSVSISQQRNMAGNCKNSLVSYGLMKKGGGVALSEFGQEVLDASDEETRYTLLAKHILKNLNGLVLIDVLREMNRNGEKATNESVIAKMNTRDFHLASTSNNVQVMKSWLEKAGILIKWRIDEGKLSKLIDLPETEFELLKSLRPEQYYFLKALCNTGDDGFQKASRVRDLAVATYGCTFVEKSFSSGVIKPLVDKGLIEQNRATLGRGAKSPDVKLTDLSKKEIVLPALSQIEEVIGKDISPYFQKPLSELRKDIDSSDTYIKGLALEAFAVKAMKIIGLDFVQTRLKGTEAAGAEVDVIFDSSRLLYTRWQVQCKNTNKVSLDQVAKEVGLHHVLKSNAIVIMTTGVISENAREYATNIMKTLNLCIIFIEGSDIDSIIEDPTKMLDVFNRESLAAKQIKVFNI